MFCFVFFAFFECISFSDYALIFLHLFPSEKRSKGFFHQITKTHGTVIGVSSGIVLVLLIISILVQMKQPRKKVRRHICLTFSFSMKSDIARKGRTVESASGIAHVALET